MRVLQLDIRHAVVLDVETGQIEQRERLGWIRRRVPRKLQNAVVVERHDPDAAKLLGRHRGGPLPRGDGGSGDVSDRPGRCRRRLRRRIGSQRGRTHAGYDACQKCSSTHVTSTEDDVPDFMNQNRKYTADGNTPPISIVAIASQQWLALLPASLSRLSTICRPGASPNRSRSMTRRRRSEVT